jgi:uncharacterized protein (TIGR03435 family)
MGKHIPAIVLFGCLVGISGTSFLRAQELPRTEFEVAAIKPAKAGVTASFTEIAPGGERFTATHTTLKLLIMTGYGVTDRQVSGGPNWVNSEYYDIDAKAPRPAGREQILQMLQALLADRFRLKLHKETRQIPTYVLLGDGKGYGLRENKSGNSPRVRVGDSGQYVFQNFPIAQFAWYLSVRLHRDVVDKTGLQGTYDFELAYRPDTPSFDNVPGAGPPDDSLQPPLLEAVRDQLGLRLQSQEGSSEILVIDAAEKPAGN